MGAAIVAAGCAIGLSGSPGVLPTNQELHIGSYSLRHLEKFGDATMLQTKLSGRETRLPGLMPGLAWSAEARLSGYIDLSSSLPCVFTTGNRSLWTATSVCS